MSSNTQLPSEQLRRYVTPSLLWQKHAQRYAEQKFHEERRRKDDFFDDVPAIVCGEALRPMTPHDLLVLDRAGNPFVCGGRSDSFQAAHVHQILWALSFDNAPGFLSEFRFRKFERRLRAQYLTPKGEPHEDTNYNLAGMILQVCAHIDAVFQDSPAPKSQADKMRESEGVRPAIGAHFLAVIMVPLSMEVGQVDPYDGRPWMFTPISRIFQYLKVAKARADGKQFTDDSPSHGVEADWLRDVNDARKAGVLVREGEIPGSKENEHIKAEDVNAAHG